MIYLDNAATTRPHPEIVQTANRCFEQFGNPSSTYQPGMIAREMVNTARKQLARAFDVPEAGIIFCGSGTESDNLALKGVMAHHQSSSDQLITTRLEHSAVIKTAGWLQQKGISVDYANTRTPGGQIDLEHLVSLIQPDTRLVSVQHVNSETGIIQDLAAISKAVKAKNPGIIVHSDGVQAFSKFPVSLKKLGVDLYSISGHKFHGIKGAGALIMARQLPLEPVIHGGGQEFGLRSGTENVAAIAAMGRAAEMALTLVDENHEKVAAFSKVFLNHLKDRFPDVRYIDDPNSVPHIISLSFPRILGEVLLNHLAEKEIYVATGSACNAGSRNLSPVLKEMGFSDQRIRETIRISMTASEIPKDQDKFLARFCGVVEKLLEIV